LQATAALQKWADTIEPSNGNLSLAQWWRALMATANLLPYSYVLFYQMNVVEPANQIVTPF